MKRIIILASLLLAASGCTTTTQAPATNAPAQTNANTAATPKAAAISEADIIAREKQLWDLLKNKDFDGFAAMIADDGIEVISQGINDKAAIIKEVKDLALTDVTLSDWKVVMIDTDAAVVTYTVSAKGTAGGQPIDPKPARTSTAWVNRGGKWLAIYHQETEAAPVPATSSSSPPAKSTTTTTTTTTAKTGASPAPSVSPTGSSSDPAEREKQVWDILKRKDYDSFAGMLADDQIEVEPDGVYDKAGTLNGVKQADFMSASLSDFKVVKLDDDAALVTYLVKMTAQGSEPASERHSTIWANRNGKWSAVFHQGTPVKPQPK
jgi:hypothetical protein